MIGLRKLPLFLLAGLLAMGLTLVACGGDDDDDGSEDSESTVTAAEETDEDDDADEEEATPDEGDEGEGEEATPTDDDGEEGDEDDGDSSGASVDACTLLTQEEVNAAMGVEMQVSEPQNFPPVFSCSWTGPALESVSISVLYGNEEALNTYYDHAEDAEEVDGLGNRAQWIPGILNFLEVQTDDYVLDVSVNAPEMGDEQAKTIAIDFAELALERVP